MIDATEIRTLAAQAKIDPGIIEKDYVLSKALMALSQIESFNQNLLFKGGTAKNVQKKQGDIGNAD